MNQNQPTEQNANKDAVKNANPAQQQGRQGAKPAVDRDESGDDNPSPQKSASGDDESTNRSSQKSDSGSSKH